MSRWWHKGEKEGKRGKVNGPVKPGVRVGGCGYGYYGGGGRGVRG